MQNHNLIMVYNADSGIFNALSDAVHKVASPKTYSCSLCAVTFGIVSMRHDWRKFLGNLPLSKKFLHRDEFRRNYPRITGPLPAIFLEKSGETPSPVVSGAELQTINDLSELIGLVQQRLSTQLARQS